MKKRWSLKGQNRGASLIAVLAAISFVCIIGIVVSQITITNIQMKQMEQMGKENFYDAEKVLDDLAAGLNSKAAVAMQKAYTNMLSQYRTVTASGQDVQEIFRRMYLDNLIEVFQDTTAAVAQKKDGVDASAAVIYEVGNYSVPVVKDSFTTREDPDNDTSPFVYADCLMTKDGTENQYRADFKAGTFVLKSIRISSMDSQTGYITNISTDIVFNTPELDFENNNLVKDYMRYSLVADTAIAINNNSVIIDGNVYAGHGGIYADTGSTGSSLNGNVIVTRGDIVANSSANFTVGNSGGTSRIYAENVKIDKGADNAKLTLQGSSYISDDLEINGNNGVVTLVGNYYGYNFCKNYPSVASTAVTGSEYSSAIVLNGRQSKVIMTNLKHLLLAGRTYIERDSENNDVMLGESISVRSSQLAYYVPDAFLNDSKTEFADGTGAAFSAYMKVADIGAYVNLSSPVTAYHKNYSLDGSGNLTMYYLKFTSDQAANNFYAEFYANNKNSMDGYAKNYLANSALILGQNMVYTLSGDMLFEEGSGVFDPTTGDEVGSGVLGEKKITITNNDWNPGGTFYDFAASAGVTYKSLQLYLEERNKNVKASDIRITKDGDRLFDYLIRFKKSSGEVVSGRNAVRQAIQAINAEDSTQIIPFTLSDGSVAKVILTEEPVYTVDSGTIQKGLVIATGDVYMNCGTGSSGFSGLVLCGGTVSFASNAHVTADEALVAQLLAEDAKASAPKFAYLFNGYRMDQESSMGEVSVEKYMSYDNWSKSIE